MIVVSSKDIKKIYGIDTILDRITFSINEGEKVGLIGANGAGKSTLFKIITGELEQDLGDFFIDKNKKVGYLSQASSLIGDNNIYNEVLEVFRDLINMEERLHALEVIMNEPYEKSKEEYENKIIHEYTTLTELYVNCGGYTYKGNVNRVLKGLGFAEWEYDKSIDILSGGQKTRVSLCKLLLKNPDILLLDEPTNHLDLEAIEWLEEYLKNYKGTIVIISHDRFFLDAVTDKTFEIINGHMNCYNGNYTAFMELRKKNYEIELKAYNVQAAEIKRQEDIIEKYRSFNREKSVKAAESREKALNKIEKLDTPDKEQKGSKIKFDTQIKSGNDVLHIEELSKSYGENKLFSNLFLDLKRSEKTALIGENGRGKTTLFKIIMDTVNSDTGIKVLGKNVQIGYYDQEQSDLNIEKTILDEVWDDFPSFTTTHIRTVLGAFLFHGDDVFKKISTLSGGEKCRINLLKLMLSSRNLLLLDEPTNHLDIASREALEDALISYDGTVLVISHDRYFLNKVVTKIYELKEEELKLYLGNYSYFIEKKKNPERFQIQEENQGKTKTQVQEERKKKREENKLEKESKSIVKNIETDISDLETFLAKLTELLCQEEIYSNSEKSEKVHKDLFIAKQELESKYLEWEELL